MSHDLTVLLDRKSEKQLHCCSREVVTAKNEDRLPFHRLQEGYESLLTADHLEMFQGSWRPAVLLEVHVTNMGCAAGVLFCRAQLSWQQKSSGGVHGDGRG